MGGQEGETPSCRKCNTKLNSPFNLHQKNLLFSMGRVEGKHPTSVLDAQEMALPRARYHCTVQGMSSQAWESSAPRSA